MDGVNGVDRNRVLKWCEMQVSGVGWGMEDGILLCSVSIGSDLQYIWIGSDRVGSAWIGLTWIGLIRIGLTRIGLTRIGLTWIGLTWIGWDRIGWDRIGWDRIGFVRNELGWGGVFVEFCDEQA